VSIQPRLPIYGAFGLALAERGAFWLSHPNLTPEARQRLMNIFPPPSEECWIVPFNA
jgi:hypothetical protein